MVKKRVSRKQVKSQTFMSTRDPKTDLIILVAILAVFALIIMFLNFPR